MLAKISILTGLIFAAIYPLCFWLSRQDPLKNNFHRFHLGLPCFVGGIVAVFIQNMGLTPLAVRLVILWIVVLLVVSAFVWNKETPNPVFVSVPCLIGLMGFIRLQQEWIGLSILIVLIGILAGLILCSAFYAMNLGHWYLNVHGLPISHLMRAMYAFWLFVALRALWDVYFLSTGKMFYDNMLIPLYSFVFTMDGFLLLIGLFFGTLFPLIALYFVKGTLEVKSTQSATGILYVILSAVLIGDLTYKYYLIKFGVIL